MIWGSLASLLGGSSTTPIDGCTPNASSLIQPEDSPFLMSPHGFPKKDRPKPDAQIAEGMGQTKKCPEI